MSDERAERDDSSRRRLARAAAASVALHMLLFGGLSVARLDLEFDAPESLEAREPRKPKRPAVDFRLQVPGSATTGKVTDQPAHERPLDLPLAPPAAKPPQPRERRTGRNVAARSERTAGEQPAVTPSPARFEPARARDTVATPADRRMPDRQVDVTAAEAPATAEQIGPARPVNEAAAVAPAPAALAGRERPADPRVAARWRPREVALLERLTARAPDAVALGRRAAPAAEAVPSSGRGLDRRSTADASSARDARADLIAVPAAVIPDAAPAVSPDARAVARRGSGRATMARTASPPAADTAADAPRIDAVIRAPPATVARSARQADPVGGSPAARGSSPGRRQPVVVGTGSTPIELPAAGTAAAVPGGTGAGPLAPAATPGASGGASGRTGPRGSALASGRQTGEAAAEASGPAAVIGSTSAAVDALATVGNLRGAGTPSNGGGAGGEGGGGPARRPLQRDSAGGTAAALPIGALAAAAPAREAATTTAGDAGEPGQRPGPALLDRGRRGTSGRSAIAAARGFSADSSGASAGDGEGLSGSPADVAALAAAGRARSGLPERVAGPQSPERIAAAALPADGRVRDVARAFAGRSAASGRPAGGIEDPATLDRARRMVDAGLGFLARSQLADGRWRLTEFAGVTAADVPKLDSDTAATGLALLAFLGAGHDHFDGRYRDVVRRGLEFLIAVQKPDGDLFLPADDLSNSCSWLYSHGIASIALCEAVGMTGDPFVRPAAERACGFIAASRHPTLGGWRYTPRSDADLSVSGWMLVALRAGELGGVQTDPAALEGVRTLLNASATPGDPTRYAYNARKADQRRTDLSVACMTAVGTLMRLHTGVAADDPGIVAAAQVLAGFEPAYGTSTRNLRDAYLWYYASQALVHAGGPGWPRWYGSLLDTLEPEQRATGMLAGSWDAAGTIPDRWGAYGGRVYVTTLHLLALEVPWRHLPTYAQASGR